MDASSLYLTPSMASYIDIDYVDERWTNFTYQDPMMSCIDPNIICPTEIIIQEDQIPYYNHQQNQTSNETFGTNITNIVNQQQQNTYYNQQQQQYQPHTMVNNYVYSQELANLPGTSTDVRQQLYASNNQNHDYFYKLDETKVLPELQEITDQIIQEQIKAQYNQPGPQQDPAKTLVELGKAQPEAQQNQDVRRQNNSSDNYEHYTSFVEPPPNLSRHDDAKYGLHESLRLHKELTKQRQERLRAQFENQPAQLPTDLLRKSTGKKMTGRERQIELERQEAEELKLRDHYLKTIKQLEAKCNKLREILENIVTTSPEYNNQMMIYLETERLMRLDEQD